MRPGAKKKFDSRGSKSKSKMALTSGDAELAVRFLEESSEEENTEEQHMRVSYRQCKSGSFVLLRKTCRASKFV